MSNVKFYKMVPKSNNPEHIRHFKSTRELTNYFNGFNIVRYESKPIRGNVTSIIVPIPLPRMKHVNYMSYENNGESESGLTFARVSSVVYRDEERTEVNFTREPFYTYVEEINKLQFKVFAERGHKSTTFRDNVNEDRVEDIGLIQNLVGNGAQNANESFKEMERYMGFYVTTNADMIHKGETSKTLVESLIDAAKQLLNTFNKNWGFNITGNRRHMYEARSMGGSITQAATYLWVYDRLRNEWVTGFRHNAVQSDFMGAREALIMLAEDKNMAGSVASVRSSPYLPGIFVATQDAKSYTFYTKEGIPGVLSTDGIAGIWAGGARYKLPKINGEGDERVMMYQLGGTWNTGHESDFKDYYTNSITTFYDKLENIDPRFKGYTNPKDLPPHLCYPFNYFTIESPTGQKLIIDPYHLGDMSLKIEMIKPIHPTSGTVSIAVWDYKTGTSTPVRNVKNIGNQIQVLDVKNWRVNRPVFNEGYNSDYVLSIDPSSSTPILHNQAQQLQHDRNRGSEGLQSASNIISGLTSGTFSGLASAAGEMLNPVERYIQDEDAKRKNPRTSGGFSGEATKYALNNSRFVLKQKGMNEKDKEIMLRYIEEKGNRLDRFIDSIGLGNFVDKNRSFSYFKSHSGETNIVNSYLPKDIEDEIVQRIENGLYIWR